MRVTIIENAPDALDAPVMVLGSENRSPVLLASAGEDMTRADVVASGAHSSGALRREPRSRQVRAARGAAGVDLPGRRLGLGRTGTPMFRPPAKLAPRSNSPALGIVRSKRAQLRDWKALR